MAYWWVNHKQTFKAEIEAGYIWSPRENRDGSSNQSYLNLTRVRPHDIVFSYAYGQIAAIGLATEKYIESRKPPEFEKTANQWSDIGWLVSIRWTKLHTPLVPKDNMTKIGTLLPAKHSPIRQDGNGNQGIYLAELSDALGNVLVLLIEERNPLVSSIVIDVDSEIQENEEVRSIEKKDLSPTFKEQLIKARVGQGKFRMELEKIEKSCRLTGVSDPRFLIASHIKPWKDSTDAEKLDGNNGLLLSPHIDRLFDKGYITFKPNGAVVVENEDIKHVIKEWNINITTPSNRSFTLKQKIFLEYHAANIFEPRQKLIKDKNIWHEH